ncbi:hypothetical protein C7974DRAFT_404345 [Boeremia exigua]|uniref:uncharacterized protein n=1 Tax=Boeremia exigua TaxID=749465 RepID=UPI001E8D2EED|nr:uncharacterized protein C7974DRAFT_404345 [Boeremia exigua]KAH6614033.1 hypothetical protein C7974DRAFT_404345 [Boeremia exigua]
MARMATATDPMDLIDIATLLNYERVTREPHSRHTKLVHVLLPDDPMLEKLQKNTPSKLLKDNIPNERTWIILRDSKGDDEQPDLPSTMINKAMPPLRPLSSQDLETVYYRIKHQDACYSSVCLLQCFFGLFPPDTPLRIRHEPMDGMGTFTYDTTISHRTGISDTFVLPKFSTAVSIENRSPQTNDNFWLSGYQHTLNHAHMGFSPPGSEWTMSLLDLSSMQFGDVGRGPGRKGRMPFVCEHAFGWEHRWRDFAHSHQPGSRAFIETLLGPAYPEDARHLQEAAQRAKDRWEKRATEKWCACCGAPKPKFKCGGCGEVWFCDRQHQKNVWPLHKGYCNKVPVGISVKHMEALMEMRQCPADRAKPSKK